VERYLNPTGFTGGFVTNFEFQEPETSHMKLDSLYSIHRFPRPLPLGFARGYDHTVLMLGHFGVEG
jgi:hypothetical protein